MIEKYASDLLVIISREDEFCIVICTQYKKNENISVGRSRIFEKNLNFRWFLMLQRSQIIFMLTEFFFHNDSRVTYNTVGVNI